VPTSLHLLRRPAVVAATLAIAASAGIGCAKAKAEVVPEGPPLAMTAPPPRLLAPVEQPLQATPAVAEVPAVPAPRAVAPPPVRRSPPAVVQTEAEPKPEVPPIAAAAPEPGRELRAAPSTADAAAERQVRDLLVRASRALARLEYRRLSPEGRSQYDQARRFADQAEDALRDRNFPYAATLADKAATLAAQLGG
jgi:hypothetical protein